MNSVSSELDGVTAEDRSSIERIRNAVDASFAPPAKKAELHAAIDAVSLEPEPPRRMS